MSVACSSSPPLLLISSSSPPPPRRPPRPPRPTATRDPQCSLSDLNHDHPCSVEVRQGTLGGDGRGWGPAGNTGRGWSWWGPAGNTWRGYSRCSLPDLNHDHPRPVFPAGPQPRVSTPSWGPAGNTGRGWSWLRSGREYWAWILAVGVRQGTLCVEGRGWAGGRGGRRGQREDDKDDKEDEEDEEERRRRGGGEEDEAGGGGGGNWHKI